MRTLYLDCVSGIAGDMALSALVDLGADPDYVIRHLRQLPIDPFRMEFEKVDRRGITAKWLKLSFDQANHEHEHEHDHHHHHDHDHHHHHEHDHHHHHEHDHHHHHEHDHHHHHEHDHHHNHEHDHHHHHDHDHHHHHPHEHRKASDILRMIESSSLPERVKARSLSIFRLIAEAEGKIHGMDPADVHFHEVGAMDSIVDVIGVCLALESLDIGEIIVSPVPTGTGRLRMAHGLYPIPAPATAELLRGVPLSSFTAQGELTTPTGAGIVKALASGFGPLPAGTIDLIGYGAGTKNFEHPNVLRAVLYQEERSAATEETIVVLEAQVDDTTGETLGYAMERLFEAGALDVYYTPVYMKKNRPGVLISVLCHPANCDRCMETLLTETSTFGVRKSNWQRKALERRWIQIETPYGPLRVKQAMDGERLIRQAPEYEDAAQAARSFGVPLEEVYRAVHKKLN
ncbi:nickel pincer cofactor biosynthesis protein LarC [Cohnella endophytica]|uniref:Pyridinium-3,5-bisthiocarboxylic acid mononucleotide nickel insertion protein n=1 Tax=Cohnella endophytica TaxID=2419778 RepID=A0A494YBV7_9BACL|nr:nickel pincer cofactor biosynthesis protein LarC [Cohnella endophytica]RKP58156.1 nickel pincer cofactor biosynthesis protein LarC [Cohnella endophytica]